MNLNGQKRRGDSRRQASTIPAPVELDGSPEVAAYLRASERVRAALADQAEAIRALRELDSRFPPLGGAL